MKPCWLTHPSSCTLQEQDKVEKQRQVEERAAKGLARAQARPQQHAEMQAARLARAKQMHEVLYEHLRKNIVGVAHFAVLLVVSSHLTLA